MKTIKRIFFIRRKKALEKYEIFRKFSITPLLRMLVGASTLLRLKYNKSNVILSDFFSFLITLGSEPCQNMQYPSNQLPTDSISNLSNYLKILIQRQSRCMTCFILKSTFISFFKLFIAVSQTEVSGMLSYLSHIKNYKIMKSSSKLITN